MFLPGLRENPFLSASPRTRIVIGSIALFIYLVFFIQHALKVYQEETFIDLPSFHTAAHVTFNDNESPFDWKKLDNMKEEIGMPEVYPYLYPPPSLFIFYPLSKVNDFTITRVIGLACNHLLVIITFYLCALEFFRRFPDKPWAILLLALFVFNFEPILTTINLGQVNLLITVSICMVGWLAFIPNRSVFTNFVIGLFLTVAIMLKVYPALLLFFFLFRKEYQVILFTGVITITLCAVSWFVLPDNVWEEWINTMLVMMEMRKSPYVTVPFGYPWNISLTAFFARIFQSNNWTDPLIDFPPIVPYLSRISTIAFLYFLFRKSILAHIKSVKPIDFHIEYGLYLLTIFLIAPTSWDHHMTMLLPGFLIVGYLLAEGNDKPWVLFVVLVTLILLSLKIPFWWPVFYNPWLTWFISIKLYAVLIVWIYLYRKSGEPLKKTIA